MSNAPVSPGGWRRVLSAAAIYFLIVFAVLMWFVKQRLWRNVEH